MKKISFFAFLFLMSVPGLKSYAGPDSIPTCSFEMYAKASEGCHVVIHYTGNASDSAYYLWNFDGAEVLSGSGQGPYEVVWNSGGMKNVTLYVEWEGQTCSHSRSIHIVGHPTQYEMNGGGSYPAGGNGVEVGLSGSQSDYAYFLLRNGDVTGTYVMGTGEPISFGLQTEPGTYTCYVQIDSSNCTREMLGSAVVTVEGPPEPIHICMVTFDTVTQQNKIIWNKPPDEGYSHFNVYKETYINEVYDLIAEVPYASLSVCTDTFSHPLVRSDKYRITVVDTAGMESEKSPYHKTIHLNIDAGVYGFNLIWNPYEGFEYQTYNIYRKFGSGPWTWIDHVPSNVTSYTDFYLQTGLAYYYIEVIRPEPCNPSLKSGSYESVISNVVVSAPLGINENQSSGVLIYPNPVRDRLRVVIPLSESGIATLAVYRLDGREVMETPLRDFSSQVDVSDLVPGLYFVKIRGEKIAVTTKIVKTE